MAAKQTGGTARRDLTVEAYLAGVIASDKTVLARAVTLVESEKKEHRQLAEKLLTQLLPRSGNAIRVGITGTPGVGKSTFIEVLGLQLIQAGHRVAVLAVDPSSGISGGSILGDKTRMTKLSGCPEAYIRPSPTSGTLGGVNRRTRETLLLCEAAGYDVVLVETVGVGQSETMVAGMTDCFLALMQPGAGDELQGIKRGLLELVDVLAVNKADGDQRLEAEQAAAQFDLALKSLASRSTPGPPPVVLTCSALEDQGVDLVWQAIETRFKQQQQAGTLAERRNQQSLRWLWEAVEQQLQQAVREHDGVQKIRVNLERNVLDGKMSPEQAAKKILETLGLSNAE